MSEPLRGPWAASLPLSAVGSAAQLRLVPGVRVAVDEKTLWLRGEHSDGSTRAAIMRVAPIEMYVVGEEGLITRSGERLPHGRLPETSWTDIARWIQPATPRSLLPGTVEERVPLTLVRSEHPRPATALVTSLQAFAAWSDDAPDFRLRPLRYAACGDRVLVLGEPTPSIDGERLYEAQKVLVPCGLKIAPPIDSSTIRTILALDENDVALFTADRWHVIPEDALVQVSRSSVRLSVERGVR